MTGALTTVVRDGTGTLLVEQADGEEGQQRWFVRIRHGDAAGILEAAQFFDGRLPEAFGGHEREETRYPVQYPTACSPQARSTGTPLLLLRTMLGLEPLGDHLVVDPALPTTIGHLELLDIPGRWGRMDAFGRGLVDVRRR